MHKIRLPCRVLMEGQPTVLDLNETLLHSKTTQFFSSSTSSSSRRSAEPRRAFTSWSAPASIGSSKPHKGSEFVVFTAGLEESESMMLDRLDCAGAISHLLYRQSCRVTDGKFVKDLSELGLGLDDDCGRQPPQCRLAASRECPASGTVSSGVCCSSSSSPASLTTWGTPYHCFCSWNRDVVEG